MVEGGVTKMKRNGARLFKNPPQPHMCIQDYIQGSPDPCYINVLSWGKIAMPHSPSEPIPLYGGMRVSPPRTEKPQVAVFAVIANPEILRLNGKNAQDPKERSTLIELLLDFVEAMNGGIIFARQYTILKDRDITGELKEVWMAVQAKRGREQAPQQETWVDVQPPVPQYPQYQDQLQQQQQHQASQPPQYHTSVTYGRMTNNEGSNYEGYGHPSQNHVAQNEQIYQPRQIVAQQYHDNVSQIAQDRYNYRERGRQNVMAPNQPQQNCPAYPGPQYQFQQLPRQWMPQYVNSNVHPNLNATYGPPAASNANINPTMNPNVPGHYQQYITLQQQMISQRQLESAMHVDVHRMQQQQQQQQQMHPGHGQPVPQYEPSGPFNVQASASMNVLRLGRPHMGVAQKSNANKRQGNSPTHGKQLTCMNCHKFNPKHGAKPKSPVKVLQRDITTSERQNLSQTSPEKIKESDRNADVAVDEAGNVQQQQTMDSDEADARNRSGWDSMKKCETTEFVPRNSSDNVSTTLTKNSVGNAVTSSDWHHSREAREENLSSCQDVQTSGKPTKTKIMVLKRNKSSNDLKGSGAKDPKIAKNGMRLGGGQQIYDLESDRTTGKEKEVQEQFNQTLAEVERMFCDNRIGFVGKQKTESPKRSQTMNSIIKSVFKIHPGTSSSDETGRRKANGQTKNNNVKADADSEEVYQGYTILRKSETNEEDVMSEIAQISIQDCKETSEVGAVLS